MNGPFEAGDTVLVPGVGVCIVQRNLPSGARIVMDCLGLVWLVSSRGHLAEKAPPSLFRALRRKEVHNKEFLG